MCDHDILIFFNILFILAHCYGEGKRNALYNMLNNLSTLVKEGQLLIAKEVVQHEKLISDLIEFTMEDDENDSPL